ncbi:hypothetical protein [Saccharothrix stipae]
MGENGKRPRGREPLESVPQPAGLVREAAGRRCELGDRRGDRVAPAGPARRLDLLTRLAGRAETRGTGRWT